LITYQQPVLDIKPYLPYSDSVKGAAVPNWLEVCTILHLSSCISPNLKIHFSLISSK